MKILLILALLLTFADKSGAIAYFKSLKHATPYASCMASSATTQCNLLKLSGE